MSIGVFLLSLLVSLASAPEDINALKEEPEVSDLISFLQELSLNPMDVNAARADELSSIPWISPALAGRILDYRKEHGTIDTLEELLRVDGIDRSLLAVLSEFLCARGAGRSGTFDVSMRARTSMRTGGSESRALRIKSTLWSVAAADVYAKRYNDGTSSFAWSLILDPMSAASIVVGDYSLGFGQGLCFDHPGMFAGGLRSQRYSIKPLGLSYGETQMSGCAVRLSWRFFTLASAYSMKEHTAKTDDNGYLIMSEGTCATSSVTETTFGERLSASLGPARVGFTVARVQYQSPVRRSGAYEDFGFTGTSNTVLGIDARYSTREVEVSTEAAQSSSGSVGVSGSIHARRGRLRISALVDNVEPGFHSFHSRHTVLHGIRKARVRLEHRGSRVKLFMDARARQDLSPAYGEKVPHNNRKLLLSTDLAVSSALSGALSFRIASDESDSSAVSNVEDRFGTELRLRVRLPGKSRLTFGVEKTSAGSAQVRGLNFRVDLNHLSLGPLNLKAGWSTYDVQDYSAAIYAYEAPVLGEKSIVLLNGRGSRCYLVSKFSVTGRINVIVKMSASHEDRSERTMSLQLDFQ